MLALQLVLTPVLIIYNPLFNFFDNKYEYQDMRF
jgi:hypothetical protein